MQEYFNEFQKLLTEDWFLISGAVFILTLLVLRTFTEVICSTLICTSQACVNFNRVSLVSIRASGNLNCCYNCVS